MEKFVTSLGAPTVDALRTVHAPHCGTCGGRNLDFPPIHSRPHPITGKPMEVFGIVGERCLNPKCAAYNCVRPLQPTAPPLPPSPPKAKHSNAKRAEARAAARAESDADSQPATKPKRGRLMPLLVGPRS